MFASIRTKIDRDNKFTDREHSLKLRKAISLIPRGRSIREIVTFLSCTEIVLQRNGERFKTPIFHHSSHLLCVVCHLFMCSLNMSNTCVEVILLKQQFAACPIGQCQHQ